MIVGKNRTLSFLPDVREAHNDPPVPASQPLACPAVVHLICTAKLTASESGRGNTLETSGCENSPLAVASGIYVSMIHDLISVSSDGSHAKVIFSSIICSKCCRMG